MFCGRASAHLCDEADVDEEVTGSDEEGVIDGGVVEGVNEGDVEEKVTGGEVAGTVSKTELLDGMASEDEGPGRGSAELEKGSSDAEEFASCLGKRRSEPGILPAATGVGPSKERKRRKTKHG